MTAQIKAYLAAAETRLYQLMVDEDFDALGALIDDDASYIHSNGVCETKAEYLAAFRDGVYEYDHVSSSETVFHLLGDGALMTGKAVMVVGPRGEPKNEVRLLSTLVWKASPRGWRLLRRHATRLPEGG